jgi:ABC-type lipoprotein release transport system permease subunit
MTGELVRMAWRNLGRNRRRTAITLCGIAFGGMLAILFTGIGDSTYGKMIDLAARLGGGHVTLQHPEALDAPSLRKTVTGVEKLRAIALGDPDARRAVARISGPAMLSTATRSYGAWFLAIDPRAESSQTLSLLDAVVQGRLFASSRDPGIVLGKQLAENLKVTLGKRVVYTLTDRNGEMVTGLGRVSGIVRTGAPSVDAGLCLLPIDTMREALGYGADEATALAVFLGDQRASGRAAGRLRRRTGPGVAVLTWDQAQPELAGFISMKVSGMRFFELIILLLAAAGIFNTMFVSVLERTRELGILSAIGFSPARLFALIMCESAWLGLLGIAASALLTCVPYYLLATRGLDLSSLVSGGNTEVAGVALDPTIRAAIYPENAAVIAAAVLLATLLSGLYPAWRAGRVAPVEVIKLV